MINTYGMKMTGLKKVATETKSLQGYFSGSYLQLNYDKSTGEVFTNYHYSLGQNSWSEYHDPNVKFICNLSSPCTMQQIADHIYNKSEFMKECQM